MLNSIIGTMDTVMNMRQNLCLPEAYVLLEELDWKLNLLCYIW